MANNSTRPRRRRKRNDRPSKPYDEFPLQPHASGHWCKRIRGRLYYFGQWGKREHGKLIQLPNGGNWRTALETYHAKIDDLQLGQVPRSDSVGSDGLRLAELCNRFLTSKCQRVDSGELSARTFGEYKEATDFLIAECGSHRLVAELRPVDFESLRAKMVKQWGPSRVGKFVQMLRTTFKYGADNGLIEKPVLFGSGFKKPGKNVMRRHKATTDRKLFTREELGLMLRALDGKEVAIVTRSGKSKVKRPANPQLKAIVLLAINAGLGNTDISELQFANLSDEGWLDYPRPKTGLPRRVPLWKETVSALKVHEAKRRGAKEKDGHGCVFLNRAGRRMVQTHIRYGEAGVKVWGQDYVSSQFRAVLKTLNINGRKGLGFYSLRHTFATIGLQTGDRDAVKALMGHASNELLSSYDETGPNDERLIAVTQHVHDWLFGTGRKRRKHSR